MFDAPFSTYQRSRGEARVTLGDRADIRELFQQGSAKAMIPRTHGPAPEVVFLNTSGGLTGGDHLSFSLKVAPGTRVMAATQTAERAYASPDGVALVDVDLTIGEGATLAWLPQETILFERSGLERKTTVSMGAGARFLGVETIVLGRAEMGEAVSTLSFRDARHVLDSSQSPLHVENFEIDSETLRRRDAPAGLAGQSVFATLTYVAEDAQDQIDAVRRLIADDGQTTAASAWDGRLILRATGHDSWTIRTRLLHIIRHLTGGHVPRVWQT